ncbi:MAG: hypothetical protein IKS90_01890 [Clostridia bacterium]|nr:hypothetical protein [Clostridia bacterium]
MKNGKKDRKYRNYSAESRLRGDSSTVSASEATGMLYCPPRSKHDMEVADDLIPLEVNLPRYGFIPEAAGQQAGLTPLSE